MIMEGNDCGRENSEKLLAWYFSPGTRGDKEAGWNYGIS
jgi:hypothetical protein